MSDQDRTRRCDGDFDVTWRGRCEVRPCPVEEAKVLVIRHHYLHKWPAVVTVRLGLYVDGVIRGVILFGHGPTQISVRYGGMTWELSRLWIDDLVPRNVETWMIGKAIRHVRKHHREVEYIVSYADPSADHTGTIYRAANFRSDGRTDQERKTPRFDYEAGGKRYGRRAHIPEGTTYTRSPRVSKLRFVYAVRTGLTGRTAERGA